jgi:hypothetical protein
VPIPTNPAASLAVVEIDLRIGEHWYVVPAATAADWIRATQSHNGNLPGYVPGLLRLEDRGELTTALLDGTIARRDLDEAAYALIAEGTGFDWWWVGHRLMLYLVAGWTQFGPRLLSIGRRLDTDPIAAVLMSMLGFINEHMAQLETPDKQRIIAELCMPPDFLPDYDDLLDSVGSLVLNDLALT